MDIVEWLRKEAELIELDRLNEAADEMDRLREQSYRRSQVIEMLHIEIERLHAEIEQLQSALALTQYRAAEAAHKTKKAPPDPA